MSSLLSIASSGLSAAQMRLDASAHNVANMNTPNFRRSVVSQAARAEQGGVDASVQRAPGTGVALEQEVVDQMSATYAFKASVQVLRTQERTLGSLLTVKA